MEPPGRDDLPAEQVRADAGKLGIAPISSRTVAQAPRGPGMVDAAVRRREHPHSRPGSRAAGAAARRRAPVQKIRVAIIGTSFGRLVQVPGFQRHPGFELVAIAGRDAEKTARIAAELGIPQGYGDWREM